MIFVTYMVNHLNLRVVQKRVSKISMSTASNTYKIPLAINNRSKMEEFCSYKIHIYFYSNVQLYDTYQRSYNIFGYIKPSIKPRIILLNNLQPGGNGPLLKD